MKRTPTNIVLVAAALIGLAFLVAPGCNSAQLASSQSALVQSQSALTASQNALAQAQATAATQPSNAQVNSAIASLQGTVAQAQTVVTAAQNAVAQAQTAQNTLGQVTAIGTAAAPFLPPPWNAIVLALLTAFGAYQTATKSTATAAASTAQDAADTANASLVQHQVALAALTGSVAPVSTAISHPALSAAVVSPAAPKPA